MTLYAVSYKHGLVGIFRSMEIVKNKLFDVYKHIPFIVQTFKGSGDIGWVVFYRDTNHIAYVTDIEEEAIKIDNILNVINVGCDFNDNIKYYQFDVDHIFYISKNILASINDKQETGDIDNTNNIIEYHS
jgi:hypothetical protein